MDNLDNKAFRDIVLELEDLKGVFLEGYTIRVLPEIKISGKRILEENYIYSCFLIAPFSEKIYDIKKPYDFTHLNKWLRELSLEMNKGKKFKSIISGEYCYINCPSFIKIETNKDKNEIIAFPNLETMRGVLESKLNIYFDPLSRKKTNRILLSDVREVSLD